ARISMSTANGFDPLRSESKGLIPSVVPVEPPLTVVPVEPLRPPHPGFWWSVLWCIGFVVITQILFPLPYVLYRAVAEIVTAPRGVEGVDIHGLQEQLTKESVVPLFALAHVGGLLMSLVALRFVAGKHWPRRVALRRPALAHTILVVIVAPAVMVLGN